MNIQRIANHSSGAQIEEPAQNIFSKIATPVNKRIWIAPSRSIIFPVVTSMAGICPLVSTAIWLLIPQIFFLASWLFPQLSMCFYAFMHFFEKTCVIFIYIPPNLIVGIHGVPSFESYLTACFEQVQYAAEYFFQLNRAWARLFTCIF